MLMQNRKYKRYNCLFPDIWNYWSFDIKSPAGLLFPFISDLLLIVFLEQERTLKWNKQFICKGRFGLCDVFQNIFSWAYFPLITPNVALPPNKSASSIFAVMLPNLLIKEIKNGVYKEIHKGTALSQSSGLAFLSNRLNE